MAKDDLYLEGASVSSGGNAKFDASGNFDGSNSSAGGALISGIVASLDIKIFYEWYDGSSWNPVTFEASNGDVVISADYFTFWNWWPIWPNQFRFRIESQNSTSGHVGILGTERS